MLTKTTGKSAKAGTHAHYAGEFGSQKMTKALEKDPAYRAARAHHFAREAHTAADSYHAADTAADKGKHALVVAHAEKMAAKHAKAAKRLAPGSAHEVEGREGHEEAKKASARIGEHTVKAEVKSEKKTEIKSESKPTSEPAATPITPKAIDKTKYDAMAKEFASNLSSDAHEAIRLYTGGGYQTMNDKLRAGSLANAPDHWKHPIQHIDNALAKTSMHDHATLYRGGGSDQATYDRWKSLAPGDHYIEKGFSSTSPLRDRGESFGSRVMLNITVPKGGKGAAIGDASQNRAEYEVLLPRNQKFRIDKIEHSTSSAGHTHMTVHVTAMQGEHE